MGRHKADGDKLPARCHCKGGAYYYVTFKNGKRDWLFLGHDQKSAIRIARRFNAAADGDFPKVAGMARQATGTAINQLFGSAEAKCCYCGSTKNLGVDHFIPHSKGGSSFAFNLVVACATCNSEKKTMHPMEFVLQIMGAREQILLAVADFCRTKVGL